MAVPSPTADQLPAPLLEAIARHGETRSFPARAILINEGDTTDSLYIVLTGRVKIYGQFDDGREVVLAEHGPGEYDELALPVSPVGRAVLAKRPGQPATASQQG